MKFEKVSYEEFWKTLERFPFVAAEQLAMAEQIYRRIKIPARKTAGSAGYDFSVPFTLSIGPWRTAYIPSGIKCYFSEQESESWHLKLFVRSSIAKSRKLVLEHGTGIIDSDYYGNPDNEGHIFMPLRNFGKYPARLNMGERVCQGIFEIHGLVTGDDATGIRSGGFGSTGN